MEEKKVSGFKSHLPNIVSCIRIFGAFTLPFLMWQSWEKEVTLPFINRTFSNVPVVWVIVYLFLIITDKIDGTLARKLNVKSELGANLDVLGDTIVLVMGATLCFVRFVRGNLETWQFYLYLGIMVLAVCNRFFTFMAAKIFHGKGNMVHSYYQKFFTVCCFIAVFFWAFLRTIPEFSIYFLYAVSIYATIDECVYCARTAEYNVNFKGHGFEKYRKRERAKS